MRERPEQEHDDGTRVGPVEIHPPEGEQQRSHESDETLSPDEKGEA